MNIKYSYKCAKYCSVAEGRLCRAVLKAWLHLTHLLPSPDMEMGLVLTLLGACFSMTATPSHMLKIGSNLLFEAQGCNTVESSGDCGKKHLVHSSTEGVASYTLLI